MDMFTFSIGLIAGALITAVVVVIGFTVMSKGWEPVRKVAAKLPRKGGTIAALALVALFMAFGALSPAHAQTPVPLEIPTDVIFTETNNWIEVFAPVAAIGIGISIAIAVLAYLGKMIRSAFN